MIDRLRFGVLTAVVVFSLLVLLGSCSDDPTTPDPETGTVVIDASPDSLNGPWILTGPSAYNKSGNGNSTLTGLAEGSYTVIWGDVSDWITPANETLTLAADETIVFDGTYVEEGEDTGTIEIDQIPDVLAGAGWSLTGPQAQTGSGDSTLTGMPVGEYTLTWEDVDSYTTPFSAPQTLAADGTVTFNGTYTPGYFVPIPAGSFTMGSPENEPGRDSDETQYEVTLTTPFMMQSTEVTNQQYADLAQWAYDQDPPLVTATSSSLRDALDGSTQELLNLDEGYCEISFSGGVFTVDSGKENHPVLEVTWYGSVSYCDWLSLHGGLLRSYDHSTWQCNGNAPYSAQGYRLPTEAEWEFACRATSETAFANGEITHTDCSPLDPVLNEIGWYCGNSGDWTHPVGQLIPNAWGLYDMHGNLYKWCNDWYGIYSGDETNPVGPVSGSYHVKRGGYWESGAQGCRSANRSKSFPSSSNDGIGFRPARSAF